MLTIYYQGKCHNMNNYNPIPLVSVLFNLSWRNAGGTSHYWQEGIIRDRESWKKDSFSRSGTLHAYNVFRVLPKRVLIGSIYRVRVNFFNIPERKPPDYGYLFSVSKYDHHIFRSHSESHKNTYGVLFGIQRWCMSNDEWWLPLEKKMSAIVCVNFGTKQLPYLFI